MAPRQDAKTCPQPLLQLTNWVLGAEKADLLLITLEMFAIETSLVVGYVVGRVLVTRSKELEFQRKRDNHS